jgi:hypothetical protein
MKDHATSRRSFLALCAGLVTAAKTVAAGSVNSHSATRAAMAAQSPASPEVSLKGKLKGGLMGPGGETTGYALQEPKLAQTSIEIDMSGIKDARKLDGKELTLTGVFQTRQYVERGNVLIFKAAAVKQ